MAHAALSITSGDRAGVPAVVSDGDDQSLKCVQFVGGRGAGSGAGVDCRTDEMV